MFPHRGFLTMKKISRQKNVQKDWEYIFLDWEKTCPKGVPLKNFSPVLWHKKCDGLEDFLIYIADDYNWRRFSSPCASAEHRQHTREARLRCGLESCSANCKLLCNAEFSNRATVRARKRLKARSYIIFLSFFFLRQRQVARTYWKITRTGKKARKWAERIYVLMKFIGSKSRNDQAQRNNVGFVESWKGKNKNRGYRKSVGKTKEKE